MTNEPGINRPTCIAAASPSLKAAAGEKMDALGFKYDG